MCCRLTVEPLDIDLARVVLTIGQFTEQPGDRWVRELGTDEQGQTMRVVGSFDLVPGQPARLRLQIEPSISSYPHHFERRIQAGVAFEIAWRFAERVHGEITQLANVSGCADGGVNSRFLASAPDNPLLFDRLCAGFRELYLHAS